MREIKFRCQHADGKWYYFQIGKLLLQAGSNEKTLGQFTGLKDKTGLEIYEGDIVKVDGYISLGLCKIVYNSRIAAYIIESKFGWTDDTMGCFMEVVGNIYENPKLMGKLYESK